MARPSRTRRILKWTGAGLSLLIVAMWVASLWSEIAFVFSPYTFAAIHSGSLHVVAAEFDVAGEWSVRTGIRREKYWGSGFRVPEYGYRWQVELRRFIPLENVGPYVPPLGIYSCGVLPLWIPLLLIATPAAWMWWRDRRKFPQGHCQRCGYNLTGNVSGVCSECGLAIAGTHEIVGSMTRPTFLPPTRDH